MFRRKDEDVAQDLLGHSDVSAQPEHTKPEDTNTENYKAKSGPVVSPAAPGAGGAAPQPSPAAASTAQSGYRPMADSAKPRSPAVASGSYRPTTDSGRTRMPEYRAPSGSPIAAPASSASLHDSGSAAKGNSNRRVLTVGNDILLKGEIATCDRLVIEGSVDATLNEVHTVEIAESGSFKGTAEIEDAEISGLFEGELVVRNRLVIYNTGKVRGKITFGEIEIERGGELTGEIKTIEQAEAKRKPAAKTSSKAKGREEEALAA